MPKTPSWKKTSDNAIRIECVCGAIHEVRSDKKGGVEVEHFNVKPPKEKVKKTDWWGNPISDEDEEEEGKE